MKNEKIHGIFVPMITGFTAEGKIDEKSIRGHVNFLINNGVHGLIPCGSTGEFIGLSLEERKTVAEIVQSEAKGRARVYVGTAHYRTDRTIELSRHAEKIGADGVMVVSPYYLKRNRQEIMEHYKAIRESIGIPIMLYNNPHFSGTDMEPDFIDEVYRKGYIQSVKEGEGEPIRVQDLRYRTDDNLAIFYGYDSCVVESLAMGCDGWVAGTGNLIPRHCVQVYNLVSENKIRAAKEYWFEEVKPFINLCTQPYKGEGSPWLAILKQGLNMIGEHGGALVKPNLPLDQEMEKKLAQVLKKMRYM